MEVLQNLLLLLGRICLSAVFLWAGTAKLLNWKGTVEYMKMKGMPTSLLPAAVLLQIVGGVSVLLGYQARIGAALLIVFLIPAAVKMHNFWDVTGPEKVTEKTLFMKDVATLGGLLLILAWGAGRFAF